MKRNVVNTQNLQATKTDMSLLGKMFIYIALRQLQTSSIVNKNKRNESLLRYEELNGSCKLLVDELMKLGIIGWRTWSNECHIVMLTPKGGQLVKRYFAQCAAELQQGHFGKFTWNKRSNFHKAIMARI